MFYYLTEFIPGVRPNQVPEMEPLWIKQYDFTMLRKEALVQLALSQEDLAREIGVSFATVNRWENGRFMPSKMALSRIEGCGSKAEPLLGSVIIARPNGCGGSCASTNSGHLHEKAAVHDYLNIANVRIPGDALVKANGKTAALDLPLKDGDSIEVLAGGISTFTSDLLTAALSEENPNSDLRAVVMNAIGVIGSA